VVLLPVFVLHVLRACATLGVLSRLRRRLSPSVTLHIYNGKLTRVAAASCSSIAGIAGMHARTQFKRMATVVSPDKSAAAHMPARLAPVFTVLFACVLVAAASHV
jgi:hypothetical protein